jgi:hypothetical protein
MRSSARQERAQAEVDAEAEGERWRLAWQDNQYAFGELLGIPSEEIAQQGADGILA